MQAGNQSFSQGDTQAPRRKLGCAFILLPISAVILLGVSIWYAYSSYIFATTGVEVPGTVVRLESPIRMAAPPIHRCLVILMKENNTNTKASIHPIRRPIKWAMWKHFWSTPTTQARHVRIACGNFGCSPAFCAPPRL